MTVLMIAIDGGTLSYNVSGAGLPIVFVAGLGDRGTYWTAQVAASAQLGRGWTRDCASCSFSASKR